MSYDRIEKCRKLMEEAGLDAVVAVTLENVLYFSGAFIHTQKTIPDRLAFAVIPLVEDPAMLVCSIEENSVRDESWISDVRTYVEFLKSPVALLAEVIKEKGLDNKRIGIELNYLSALYYKELIQALPNTTFVQCANLFQRVRMIKEEKEIEILAYAGFSTRKAFEAAVLCTKPGETEIDLGKRAQQNLFGFGFSETTSLSLASGKRSLLVHALPSNNPLENGEIARIDFGGLYKNYVSDVARTVMIGTPNPKHVDVFSRIKEVYDSSIEKMIIGTPVREIYLNAQKVSEKVGLPFVRVHNGHSIGLSVHEFPMITPNETQPLLENMVLCFEHAVHLDGYRYHVEDLIHITPSGPKVLTETKLNTRLLELA